VGRLAPDASLTSAAVEAGVIATRYDAMHPGQRTTVVVSLAAALDAGLVHSGSDRTKAIGLGAVVVALAAVLLLICTSNAAALLLARAVARQREIAIRIALGAGRWRGVQHLMTESAQLALIAAAVGLALCTVVLRTTAHLLPLTGYFDRFVPDLTVLSFASLAALAATVLFRRGTGRIRHSSRSTGRAETGRERPERADARLTSAALARRWTSRGIAGPARDLRTARTRRRACPQGQYRLSAD
jgi:predicted lysophospholipase L1 biosynthesis ABC-type transport system permease subunit